MSDRLDPVVPLEAVEAGGVVLRAFFPAPGDAFRFDAAHAVLSAVVATGTLAPVAPVSGREARLEAALITIREGFRGLDVGEYTRLAHATAVEALTDE